MRPNFWLLVMEAMWVVVKLGVPQLVALPWAE